MQDLHRVLGALLKTAERATRLLASGSGSARAKTPAWLRQSTDFVVTGLSRGSTIIEIDAPRLDEVADDAFAHSDFWIADPEPGDSSLDLAAEAILEAEKAESTGERFDASALESILEFKAAVRNSGATFELRHPEKNRKTVSLSAEAYKVIDTRKAELPAPQAFIISGKAADQGGEQFAVAVHPHACGEGSRIVKHLGDLKANLCLKRKGAL